jgi:hypothetical protein
MLIESNITREAVRELFMTTETINESPPAILINDEDNSIDGVLNDQATESTMGYISNFNAENMRFALDNIDWLTVAGDSDQLISIGINPNDLPNGFYIREWPDIPSRIFEFNNGTEFGIIDYKEYCGEHRIVGADEFSAFLSGNEAAGIRTLCTVEWDTEVVRVFEQYLP